MGAQQTGQRSWAVISGSVARSSAPSRARQRTSILPRLRLAKKPKWRMRTKPLGRTWTRKRQELICGDRHDLLLAAVRIVFPAKRDSIILERHQSMVGDGDAVRIASEIVQNMLGTAEGWLGIDDPVLVEELSEKLAKATWLSKTLE